MSRILLVGLLLIASTATITTTARAMEVAGVSLPASTSVGGKTLVLNGAGLRTRFFFKVYVIGLYLERPTTDAAAILGADGVRQVELHLLRPLAGKEIASAIGDAFERNAGDARAALQERLQRFEAMFPAVNPGDVLALTYVPGRGTAVVGNGKELGLIDGKDFADVLFAAWIGANPVDPDLKRTLLAGGA